MREPNPDKLNELVGKLVGDLGAAIAGAGILLGDRLGIYKAMADGTPVTSSDLAKKTGLHERYLREWLSGQAASGYIDYHAEKKLSRSHRSKPPPSPKKATGFHRWLIEIGGLHDIEGDLVAFFDCLHDMASATLGSKVRQACR